MSKYERIPNINIQNNLMYFKKYKHLFTNPERNKLNHSINDKQSIIENDRQMKCSMQLVISGTAAVTNRTN